MKSRNDQLADVIRITRSLEKNASGIDCHKLYSRFCSTTQEPVRLAAALRGFFRLSAPSDQQDVYAAYLRKRIRPAAEAVIVMDDMDALEQMEALGWLDAALTDYFLQLSCHHGKTAAMVWLLHLKNKKYGFQDRSFEL